MVISPPRIPKLSMYLFIFCLIISCNKDTDLLLDYVSAEDIGTENLNIHIVSDFFTTTSDTEVVLDVLMNDSFQELEEVSIIETSAPTYGDVKINENNNTVTYSPTIVNATEETTDTFTYTTEVVNEDQSVSTEVGTVEVTIVSSDEDDTPTEPSDEGSQTANLLFSSGFESGTVVGSYDGNESYQYITGTDASTGFEWPPLIWGSGGALENGIHVIKANGGTYTNELQTVTGHGGSSTTALFQEVVGGVSPDQDPYQINDITEDPTEFYVKYWTKVNDMSGVANDTWRVLFEYKSDDWHNRNPNADGFRLIAYINKDSEGNLYWRFMGDEEIWPPIWNYDVPESTLAVPQEEWFKVEYYVKLSHQNDGRAWMKINDVLIGDHTGPNLGNATDSIDFLMLFQMYSNEPNMHQWIDDIEIWDGVPY